MTNDQILSVLREKNALPAERLAKLEREVLLSGRTVEEIVHEGGLVSDEELAKLKSEQLKVPYRKVDVASIKQELFELIPEDTARTYGIIPIEKRDDLLVAGMLSPDDPKAQEALKFVARSARLNLGVYLISWGDLQDVLRRYSPYKSEVERAVKSLNLKEDSEREFVELEEARSSSEDAPVIKIVADSLREAVHTGASDVHIEPQKNYVRIRFRVGGDLQEGTSLPSELAGPVVSRVKVMSRLRIDENRVPQDGRFRSKILDREIDFRVSTFPTPLGEKVAIRVLDPRTGLKTLDDLGLEGRNRDTVEKGIARPYGMVLISGPTGSGKTTTLYSVLQELNNEKVNIVSLEDPVEYFIEGINQSQVRPEIGYTFASGLRQILRQDPDIIMVGEVRDTETAGLSIHAALTGHVVLSTIHTSNALGVVPRLVDMGVEPFLIPEALTMMISQRLVGRLCSSCKKEETVAKTLEDAIDRALEGLPTETLAKAGLSATKKPYKVFRAPGCGKCNGKGREGRVAIFEVLEMTSELGSIIESGLTSQKLAAEARRQGMTTMRQDGVQKALRGIVGIEEVMRETSE